MKRLFFAVTVLLFVLSFPVFSLDIELTGGLGNLAFDKGRTSALSVPGAEKAFDPQLFPLGLARVSDKLGDIAWNGGFEYDPLMRSRLFGNVKLERDYFFVEAGPFLSLFNTSKLPVNPGVSAALGLQIPGIIFARAGGSSTLAFIDIEKKGNHRQYGTDISAGFWVPYVVCSLNMSFRDFAVRENANLFIKDELTRYFFSADVFTKNVPYTIRVDLGYQSLSRSYTTPKAGAGFEKETQKDEFKSIFTGFEARYTVSPALKFLLGGEMPVYSWGVRPMKDPPDDVMLFQVRAGVILSPGE